MGICDDFMAEPFHRFRAPERERIRKIVEEVTALRKGEELRGDKCRCRMNGEDHRYPSDLAGALCLNVACLFDKPPV